MLAGIDSTTCAPTAATLEPDWVTACNALKVVRASECASLWKNFQENAVLAFGPLTAQALNADFQLLASSGSGPSPAALLCQLSNMDRITTFLFSSAQALNADFQLLASFGSGPSHAVQPCQLNTIWTCQLNALDRISTFTVH